MKNFVKMALATALLISIGGAAYAQPPAHAGKDGHGYFVSGQILVKPRAGVAERVLQNIFSGEEGIQSRAIDKINVRIVRVPEGKEQMIIERLSKNPRIEFAELDRYAEPVFIPDDPLYPSQWHHPKIGAAVAWDITQGDPGVISATLDSGVDGTHPDLAPHIVSGWNCYGNNFNTSDVYGHGTKVAGATAAIGNNAVGVSGVAPNVKIMPIRVTGTDGWASTSCLANGLVWAADHGARIANMSFANTHTYSSVNASAGYMRDRGGIVFGSAGNYGTDDGYPDAPNIITVSATGSSDIKAGWSSFGNSVDIAAPGVSIYTTANGGGYSAASGTSLSSPVAAGVGALILSANPALSADDVETILETTAVDLGDPGYDIYYGHGRVDAAAAVQMALTYQPPVRDTIAPTVAVDTPSAGSTVAGTVVVDATANDNIGVTKVDLYVNGAFYATDTSAPYSFAWDTASLGNADVTLAAHAYDAAGNKAVSSGVSVHVRNVVDTTPPVVTISEPANGATISGRNTTISASATDNLGVSAMRLFIDGSLVASSSGGSLSYNWNLRKVADGTHSIHVEATDASANVASQLIEVIKGGGSTGGGGGGGGKGGPKNR
ncbi:MAG: S8 family serine peptidase [Alphaproteobacteria bacterium]|nr:S8 family serine peptidase [Alphaproteobacteria bacterium]